MSRSWRDRAAMSRSERWMQFRREVPMREVMVRRWLSSRKALGVLVSLV